MKASTVAALERINRHFYRRRAREFSDTRQRPWPGWQRVLELAREHLASDRISVLDLGCGNGRFLAELERVLGGGERAVGYLGIDASVPLLADTARAPKSLAKEGASGPGSVDRVDRRLLAADLVRRPLAEIDARARFDLIVLFGLMHHIPSRARRRALLGACVERLPPGGILAVSFWQFGDHERFAGRLRSWNDPQAAGVDPEDLEEGDALLAWGDAGAVRYCHFADPIEAGALVDPLGLEVLANFSADGGSHDLNLYWILRKGDNT